MADTDMIDVTFKAQKVFHDGTSMVVAKKGDSKPVERRMVPGLIDDGSINEPSGWAEEMAEKNEMAVADGSVQVAPPGPAAPAPADDKAAADKTAADKAAAAKPAAGKANEAPAG